MREAEERLNLIYKKENAALQVSACNAVLCLKKKKKSKTNKKAIGLRALLIQMSNIKHGIKHCRSIKI